MRDKAGRPIEIQIRTQAMHDHAEHGVAAHWAYKEAGQKGYAGVSASGEYDAKIAVLRQLLAWERDLAGSGHGLFEDRIYVLTPDAAIVELPQGATPVDFAYTLHTNLGHRCRGARVDGAMVPLNTPLQNGQTVEITAAKEGGPSRDWLNADLGFLASHRAKAKVRAWFNEQIKHETVARGREAVEKLLQREGKTAVKLEDLASQLGFKSADDLFAVVGKDEYSLRNIETLLRPPEAPLAPDDFLLLKKPRHPEKSAKGGVLVVGIDSLMTQLAKCCKPAPPDAIGGFVTRGKGVSVHRARLQQFPRAGRAQRRARDRRGMGHAEGRWRRGVPGRRRRGSRRPAGAAARHLGSVRQGKDERDRRADPVAQGHGLDDVHGGSDRFRPPEQGAGRWWPRSMACAGPGADEGGVVRACYNRNLEHEFRRVAQLVRAPP